MALFHEAVSFQWLDGRKLMSIPGLTDDVEDNCEVGGVI